MDIRDVGPHYHGGTLLLHTRLFLHVNHLNTDVLKTVVGMPVIRTDKLILAHRATCTSGLKNHPDPLIYIYHFCCCMVYMKN